MNSLYLAWKYLRYHKLKTLTLIACATLIAVLPFSLEVLLRESERQLMDRAASTPLVIGAKGSSLDLLMNTLYFGDEVPELISMDAVREIEDSNLARAIPLYIRFRARDFPIIGTTLEYFEFRKLRLARGHDLTLLGDCVLGSKVAETTGLGVGDNLVSSPENLFQLAGVYPLKMKIVGVLEESNSADDLGVFVDLKTAWIIEGRGHGHQDLAKTRDQSVILDRQDGVITANAKLPHFQEITDENVDSFHFHGDLSGYPVTAVVALPVDQKSAAILQGRYVEDGETVQIVRSREVISGLLQNIFRIKSVLDAVVLVVGAAALLAILLVFALSLKLRADELQTMFKLGCSQGATAKLLASEVLLIGGAALLVCLMAVALVQTNSAELVRRFFVY